MIDCDLRPWHRRSHSWPGGDIRGSTASKLVNWSTLVQNDMQMIDTFGFIISRTDGHLCTKIAIKPTTTQELHSISRAIQNKSDKQTDRQQVHPSQVVAKKKGSPHTPCLFCAAVGLSFSVPQWWLYIILSQVQSSVAIICENNFNVFPFLLLSNCILTKTFIHSNNIRWEPLLSSHCHLLVLVPAAPLAFSIDLLTDQSIGVRTSEAYN